jgi:hypothetical protein
MGRVELTEGKGPGEPKEAKTTILIFTEGTILGPKRWIEYFFDTKYIPIKNCVSKIRNWERQGADISYLTSRTKKKDVDKIRDILIVNNFPGKYLYFREAAQRYRDIVEEVLPMILIEDDCRSIGGKWQMTITYVRKEIKEKMKSIIVKEFGGIDHLPDNLDELRDIGR